MVLRSRILEYLVPFVEREGYWLWDGVMRVNLKRDKNENRNDKYMVIDLYKKKRWIYEI